MHYFYHFEYNVEDYALGVAPLVLALRVFAVADKYFVEPLQQMALNDISERVGGECDTPSFSQGIRELYTMSPIHVEALKDNFLDIARQSPDLFVQKDKYPEFQTALETVPQFAIDVAIDS
ncbi:hypothetical protein BDY17DRAFT_165009 [Neohortaea acidophila]|uniref:Uncharacterized protein n=1 Tax=Neohortaea acidophila TaxID=245834 RepID=A0A6A6PSQ8_9PEZI|nr:uncharacterized protein BDY17DRAFT_165009 [Neohortaea acidophila]KAF2482714.1 hypothetical protein BDY17DRAFT_165009 [Neohortaea acidophila]